jgi:hypothetical protein
VDSLENLRVLEGSEVFFRGLQHLYPQFKSGWHLLKLLIYSRALFAHKISVQNRFGLI